MSQNVSVDWSPPLCTITFNDPDTLNAFTNAGQSLRFYCDLCGISHPTSETGHDQFADALEEAERRSDIYIVGPSRSSSR